MDALSSMYPSAAAENQGAGGQGGAGGNGQAGATPSYWPEGLPETLNDFKGANDKETIDKLSAHLKDAPRAPAKPDDYKLALPEAFTKRYGDLSNDEVLPIWRQVAHKNGLTDAQFNGAISQLYSELSTRGVLEEPIDVQAELEQLMPKHGDSVSRKAQAIARINSVITDVRGLVNRQVLNATEANMVLELAATAHGVVTLEKMFKHFSEHGLQGGGQGDGQQGTQHERQLKAMFPSSAKVS